MTVILFTLFSLCPLPDTGKFYFMEFLKTQEQVDTFYGTVRVYPEKIVKMEVKYPQKQLFLFRSDSILMIFDSDTQVIYRRGLSNLIFNGSQDSSFVRKEIRGGCMVIASSDSMTGDTLFIFGRKSIDSLKFVGNGTTLNFHLRREK